MDVTVFVTDRNIDTAVPPIWEKMRVRLRINEPVVLLENRVPDVCSALGASTVIIRCNGPCWNTVHVSWGCANKWGKLTDERIENTGLDRCQNSGPGRIAA